MCICGCMDERERRRREIEYLLAYGYRERQCGLGVGGGGGGEVKKVVGGSPPDQTLGTTQGQNTAQQPSKPSKMSVVYITSRGL